MKHYICLNRIEINTLSSKQLIEYDLMVNDKLNINVNIYLNF